MESDRKPRLESSGSSSFNYSSASLHSVETHKDLQKGISLLKKSVACLTTYCYSSLCLDVPTEASTFEAFAKLLAILSSSKEVRSVFSLKMACSRYILLRSSHMWYLNLCIFMFFCIPILIPNIDSVSFYWFYYESSYSIQSLLFFGEHLNLYWMTIPLGIKATSVLQLTLALCGIEKCNICPLFIDVGPFSAVGLYKL